MPYLSRADYMMTARSEHLDQITDGDNTLLDAAEKTAIAFVRDALHSRYDVDYIFARTGTARHRQVVRWVTTLSLYYLYERIEDSLVPETIIANYEQTLDDLRAIADGKRSTELPSKPATSTANTTKFRWGSDSKRNN